MSSCQAERWIMTSSTLEGVPVSDRFQPATYSVPGQRRPDRASCVTAGAMTTTRSSGCRWRRGREARRDALMPAVPRRPARHSGWRAQAACQRHRLPVPRRHRARLPHRQPDVGCSLGDRRRRSRRCSSVRATPRATTPSGATAATARRGRAAVGPRPRPRSSSASPAGTLRPARRACAPAATDSASTVVSTLDVDALVEPTRPTRGRPRARGLHGGDATDQGRVGGRPAPRRRRLDDPRLRGLRPRVGQRRQARRALARRHVLAPRPRQRQRRRLRVHRRGRPACDDPALDRELRSRHARPADPARHGGREPLALHRRRHPDAAGRRRRSPPSNATSTTWCSPPRRPGWPRSSRASPTATSTWRR